VQAALLLIRNHPSVDAVAIRPLAEANDDRDEIEQRLHGSLQPPNWTGPFAREWMV
jgi:hypothetical protein